jgi:type IV secretory pathway TraG/TraD family ATPase VirD4
LLEVAEDKAKEKDRESDLDLTRDYWLREFPSLAEETRSVIVSTFTSMADCFLRGMLRKLFCTRLDFKPEDTFDGKIIILNLPVKEHNELGQFAQVLFKYVWQRAVERRIPPLITPEEAEQTIRPVFLWADESQFFANSYDALFQSTARSSRACTVYLTQNLPSYFAAFGGANSRAEVEAFIGNLQTKIFHANGDPTTNNWAADSVGKTRQMRYSGSLSEQLSRGQGNPGVNQSAGGSEIVEYLVQPQEFTMLRTGGEESEMQVDGIIFQGGRRWVLPGKEPRKVQNHIRHVFPQVYG